MFSFSYFVTCFDEKRTFFEKMLNFFYNYVFFIQSVLLFYHLKNLIQPFLNYRYCCTNQRVVGQILRSDSNLAMINIHSFKRAQDFLIKYRISKIIFKKINQKFAFRSVSSVSWFCKNLPYVKKRSIEIFSSWILHAWPLYTYNN